MCSNLHSFGYEIKKAVSQASIVFVTHIQKKRGKSGLYKQIRYINDDGETVYKQDVRFKGRFHDNKGYTLYAHGKTVHGRDIPFPDDLTPLEIGYLTILSRHLLVDSNIIGKKTKRGTKPYTINEIGDLLGIRSIYRFMKRMIDMKMIAKDGKHYIINPLYFLKGKTISDELYWLFNESIDHHLSQWIRDMYIKRKLNEDGTS